MSKNLKIRLLVVIGLTCLAAFFTFPLNKRINLGLDLKGGMHLILKVETEKLDANAKADAVPRAIEILRNRIDGLGVAEPVIQRQGENQIIIQLPGVTDRDSAVKMIGRVAQLEFALVNPDPLKLKDALNGSVPSGYLLKYSKEKSEPVLIEEKASIKGDAIADAVVDFDNIQFGEPQISLTFNAKGASDFANVTRRHVGERLAIVLDGEILSAPNIKEAILSGKAMITGQFTYDEAALLALALRSGSLPAPMHMEEERTIGPLLGKDSIMAGVKASIIGLVLVFAFMAIYYMTSGLVANVALFLNLLFILGTMGLIDALMPESQVTLSLPGIAGIILTLGMAVDANVLINERIREELENGRPLGNAISTGYNRAFSAILDSNLTTLIAAFMLFQFGSGPIKGFAVTLTIGLLASMFTAIYVTRTIFMVMLELKVLKSLPMLHLFKRPNINFLSFRYVCFALSLIVVVVGLMTVLNKKQAAYGIDFVGGQIQEYRFKNPIASEDLRTAFQNAGIKDVVIQRFDKQPENVILRTAGDTYEQVSGVLKTDFQNNSYEVLRLEQVGPVVGQALRQKAILAIILSLVGILVYVAFRFKHLDFAVAGVIALLHDVIIAMGLTVMSGRQIDLLVVTALLTIAGYSINDTIVTYDRVRENAAKSPKMPLADLLNLSVNQTLGRTVLTSSVTLLVVISLFGFGGEILNTFSFCILVGFITGAYSTVFIASPMILEGPSPQGQTNIVRR